jgi:hypothetical protein
MVVVDLRIVSNLVVSADQGSMSDLLQVLLMMAVPASVLLWCRFLNRRDERRAGAQALSSDGVQS